MIAERRSLLLQSADRWENRRTTPDIPPSRLVTSLSDRLSSLSSSTDGWRTRVKKESSDLSAITPCRPRARSKRIQSQCTSIHIDDGLSTFFGVVEEKREKSTEEFLPNLDDVPHTQLLQVTRRPTVPRHVKGRVPSPKEHLKLDIQLIKPLLSQLEDDSLVLTVCDDFDSPVAKSAREGLAAVEDYSETRESLRETKKVSPYPHILLIQVKGEDGVDVRCVSPSWIEVHSNASFVLVTPKRVMVYHGENSVLVERTKALQMATCIANGKELWCEAREVERASKGECAYGSFFSLLGGTGPGEEREEKSEEDYQRIAAKCNVFISVTVDCDVIVESKRCIASYSMLQPHKCFIFDFGTELYVWSGLRVKRSQTKCAILYAQQIKDVRPSIVFVRRLCQGMLDVLFSSKFIGWPAERLITSAPCTPVPRETSRKHWKHKLTTPTDATRIAEHLLSLQPRTDEIVLEDVSLSGKEDDVVTEKKDIWILIGDELESIEYTHIFERERCYVVRWQYRIETRVRRMRTGSRCDRETGRQRVAFFYWLGRNANMKEHGLVALRLSDMDKEKRPHIRMEEGAETGIFLSLFSGLFTVRSSSSCGPLFIVHGLSHGRSCASEVSSTSPLRSDGVYVRVEREGVTLLAGTHCTMEDVRAALHLAHDHSDRVMEQVQGEDPSLVWIESIGRTQPLRMYRILADESDEIQPSRPGCTFAHCQSSLVGCVIVWNGSKGWLWTEGSCDDLSLKVADAFSSARDCSFTVVWKGCEPEELTALFAEWTKVDEDEEVSRCARPLKEVIRERQSTRSVNALREKKELPDGMDTTRLEQYLQDNDFEKLFKMERDSFYALPQWKQIRMRKDTGLF